MSTTDAAQQIIGEFRDTDDSLKLELLLEYANSLPELPERLADHQDQLEQVTECQSPVYLRTEIDQLGKTRIFITAPREAPTTRGFASLLFSALDGQKVEYVLDFSDRFIDSLGLTKLVSALRIRGMAGMLARIKRQLREQL